MLSALLYVWMPFALAGLVQALLGLLQTWEHRRFAASRCHGVKAPPANAPRVLLCVPCKGLETGLAENLRPLFEQDHPNYELTFVVEAADDPAVAVIQQAIAKHPQVDARLVIAGLASHGGQKVHNLRAATARLDRSIAVLAFADSDARPHCEWLSRLVARLDRIECGATTGYRWFVPQRRSLANALLYSINAGVASMLGPGGHHLVWGGSWAISRATFERLAMHDAWRDTVSDDLVISRVLAQAGLKIEFVPECMVASPLDVSLPQLGEFIRRQYMMARFNVPKYFILAGLLLTSAVAALWGGLLLTLLGAMAGASWWPLACGAFAAIYTVVVARGLIRQRLLHVCLPDQSVHLRRWAWFDCLAAPAATFVHWLGWTAALLGRCVTWRGITYKFQSAGRVQILNRTACATPCSTSIVRQPHSHNPRAGETTAH